MSSSDRHLRIECPRSSDRVALPGKTPAVKVDEAKRAIENEFVKLTIRPDGRIDLYDRETRTRYSGLHFFEDCGDAGQGWSHYYPDKDVRVLSTNAKSRGKVKVRLLRAGRLSASFEVSMALKVPDDLKYMTVPQDESIMVSYENDIAPYAKHAAETSGIVGFANIREKIRFPYDFEKYTGARDFFL